MKKTEKIAETPLFLYNISDEERLLFDKYNGLKIFDEYKQRQILKNGIEKLNKSARIEFLKQMYPGLQQVDAERIDKHASTLGEKFSGAATKNDGNDLPVIAPALWSDRTTGREVSPIDFIRKYYEKWLGNGLTRNLLRQLDRELYQAFSAQISRMRRNGKAVPQDILPLTDTPQERLDAELKNLGISSIEDVREKVTGDPREAHRLRNAIRRREKQ